MLDHSALYNVLRHLQVYLVQRDILWLEKIREGSHIFTEQSLIGSLQLHRDRQEQNHISLVQEVTN